MTGSCTRISQQGLGSFSPLIKTPAAAGFHRDQAEEVGSYLARLSDFSALRRQVMRKKSSHSSGPSVHNVIGGGETATSTDGKTWTTHDYNDLHLPYPYDLHAITWSKDLKLFVAVGGAGSYDFIGTSSNGRSWVKQHPPVSPGLSGIAWSGSQFVAVGGNTILTSSDGRNWVEQGVDVADPDTLYGVTSSGSQFVAVGVTPESSGIILTSYDRKTWVKQNSPSSSDLTGVA